MVFSQGQLFTEYAKMGKHVRPCKSEVGDTQWSLLAQTHAQNSAEIGVISIGKDNNEQFGQKALALPMSRTYVGN